MCRVDQKPEACTYTYTFYSPCQSPCIFGSDQPFRHQSYANIHARGIYMPGAMVMAALLLSEVAFESKGLSLKLLFHVPDLYPISKENASF